MHAVAQERCAQNESLFREVNEQILGIATTHGAGDSHVYSFFCECCDPNCRDRVEMPLEEYESVREDGRRFLIAPGHAATDIEEVVEIEDEHQIVEKVGVAGTVAARLDPRAA